MIWPGGDVWRPEAVQDFGGLFGRDLSKEPLIIRPKSLVDDTIDERNPAPSTRQLYIPY